MTDMDPVRPGWHVDPRGGTYERWWDGSSWTTATRPLGSQEEPPSLASPLRVASTDGYATSISPPPFTAGPPVISGIQTPTYPGPSGYATPQSLGTPPSVSYPGAAYGAGATPVAYGQYAAAGPLAPTGSWRGPVDDRPPVNGMGAAIRSCFQRYASFDGRAGRGEYWYWVLFTFIAYSAASLISLPLAMVVPVLLPLFALAWLSLVLPSLAVMVRRLRDAGYAWPWLFISFVPFGSIALLVMMAQPSKYP